MENNPLIIIDNDFIETLATAIKNDNCSIEYLQNLLKNQKLLLKDSKRKFNKCAKVNRKEWNPFSYNISIQKHTIIACEKLISELKTK